jgi:hypothetical protein
MAEPQTITLVIEEEYGYKWWVAKLTEQEWQDLRERWQTIRGLNCLGSSF